MLDKLFKKRLACDLHFFLVFEFIETNKNPFLDNNVVSNVVELLNCRADDHHGNGSKSLTPYCCVLVKDTLRHFSMLGGIGKQF